MPRPKTVQDRVASVPPPPTGCLSFVEATDTGAALIVPPQGFRRGGKGLTGFSIGLLATGVVLGGVGLVAGSLWGAVGGSGLVVLGLAGLLFAWDRATHRGFIDVLDDYLVITTRHLVARDQRQIPVNEIVNISLARSADNMDEREIYELAVWRTVGKVHRYFPGRDNEELQWIVVALRHLLDMPDEPDPERVAAYEAALREAKEKLEIGRSYEIPPGYRHFPR